MGCSPRGLGGSGGALEDGSADRVRAGEVGDEGEAHYGVELLRIELSSIEDGGIEGLRMEVSRPDISLQYPSKRDRIGTISMTITG